MSKVLPYASFWERSLLRIKLISSNPIHIGSGDSEQSKQVLRVVYQGRDEFIIPSNSIKGVLRSLATMLARSMDFEQEVMMALKTHKKDKHNLTDMNELKKLQSYIESIANEKEKTEINSFTTPLTEESDRYNFYASLLCPVCRLFGSRVFASKLSISDAIPLSPYYSAWYMSNAISRKTRTVAEKRLFDYEYIYSSNPITFELNILADNLSGTDEGKLFSNLIRFILASGMQLGGLKSKGYGLVRLDEKGSQVKYATFVRNNGLQSASSNLKKLLFIDGHEELSIEQYATKL